MRQQLSILLSLVVMSGGVAPAIASSTASRSVVTPASSAEAQLAQASRLWQQLERTPPPQKQDLIAEAMGNLVIVRKLWPNDKRAVVRSGIMQADLLAEFGGLPLAINALLEALPAASKTDQEPGVELRLGKAYDQSGNPVEAERHFLNAERTMRSSHLNRLESHEILNSVGLFYSRQDNPAEAIQRFHEAQLLQGLDVVAKANLQLSVVKEAIKLPKEQWTKEFATFDSLIAEGRRTTLSPGDAAAIEDLQKHATKVREKTKQ